MTKVFTVLGTPVGKPRKRVPYKIVAVNKAWFKSRHGMRKSVEYATWNSMISRCYLPSVPSYPLENTRAYS